ncbi:MAG: hypothetical protein AAF830_03055 [Pseudomonadota bacterium]
MLLASCASSSPTPDQVMDRTWEHVAWATKATPIDSETMRIESLRSFGRSVSHMEYDAIARAAAEAKRIGAPNFVITYADYEKGALAFGPQFSSVRKKWIGSYADLLQERTDQSLDMGPFGAGSVVLVVQFLGEDNGRYRETFSTEEVYDALFFRKQTSDETNRPQ